MKIEIDILDPKYNCFVSANDNFAIAPAKKTTTSGLIFKRKVKSEIVWCVLGTYGVMHNMGNSIEETYHWRVIETFDYRRKSLALDLLNSLKDESNS